MNIPVIWVVIARIIFLFLQYVIIETAVRRGLDSSKTHELLEEVLKNLNKKDE